MQVKAVQIVLCLVPAGRRIMRPISTEEIVAYFAKTLSSDRARAIEDLSKVDTELAARIWLITATAGYCREDMIPANAAATEGPPTDPRALETDIDSFERAWIAGQRPRIEVYLADAPRPEAAAHLRELLALELAYRRSEGESPSLEEYCTRFPTHAELIADVFREIGASFDARALKTATDTALGTGNLARAHQEKLAAYFAGKGATANREPARELWSHTASVTMLIGRVKEGDEKAAQELFARYYRRLTGLARAKLRGKCLRAADEEDVVQSVFVDFFRGAEQGQYTKLHDRDALWHLLVKRTIREAQKLVKEQERQKRHPGTQQEGTPSPGSGDRLGNDQAVKQVVDPHPSPEHEVLANETIEHLLQGLGDSPLRTIAVWKGEGYSNEEIASMLGCSSRTVLRKLRLIRTIWSQEEQSESP
jgi:RNA polymerase sigma factor (sigma-70 family)